MVSDLQKYLNRLEVYLDDHVYAKFPQLADYLEEPLIKYLPFISIILGLLCILSAYNLWHTAHSVNSLIGYANTYGSLYGIPKVPIDHHMNLAFWLSEVILLTEAYLFFKAFSATSRRLKAGWNLIYYALLLNVVYGIIMLWDVYGSVGTLLERFLFSLICLYFLFEIRDSYKTLVPKKKAAKPKKKAAKAKSKKA